MIKRDPNKVHGIESIAYFHQYSVHDHIIDSIMKDDDTLWRVSSLPILDHLSKFLHQCFDGFCLDFCFIRKRDLHTRHPSEIANAGVQIRRNGK